MEHVIAFDPGERTGWSSALMSEDRLELTGGGVLRQDLMSRRFAAEQQVMYAAVTESAHEKHRRSGNLLTSVLLLPRTYDVMVFESWKPRRDEQGRMDWIESNPLLSVQHIGQLRLIADLSGTRIVEQHPSDKPMAVATMPDVLADLDRYSNEQHDKDARMHLWLYFWRNWFVGKGVRPKDTVIV